MVEILRRIANAPVFQNFITATILFAALLVGVETYESMATAYASPIHILNEAILAIFIIEIVVKMGAEFPKPHRYFLDPWNIFDFVIVVACFIPGMGQYAVVLRLLRLLRVLKLVGNEGPMQKVLTGYTAKKKKSLEKPAGCTSHKSTNSARRHYSRQ